MQRIVELQESWRIMVEFNTHGGAGQQYQDHKVRLWGCGWEAPPFLPLACTHTYGRKGDLPSTSPTTNRVVVVVLGGWVGVGWRGATR